MPHANLWQSHRCARCVEQHTRTSLNHLFTHSRSYLCLRSVRTQPDKQGRRVAFRCAAHRARAGQAGFSAVPEQYTGDLEAAYLAGCKAGYAAGVNVTVNVSVDGETGVSEVQQFGDIQKDSLLRSLLKGVVWRVFSTALTVSIILAVFHDTVQVEQALQIGGLEFVLKLVVYFLHERLWVQIGTSIS